ncbi:MAG: sulfatase [Acidobacteria bacterium]|nr:sulfatase [Acidobacteriota bacterium]
MTRRQWLFSALAQAQSKQLNFIFILADDLGGMDLPVYGADLHETPELDAFAKTAMRFTQAYAAAPICSPTRASIMTGKAPARLGITIWHEGALRKVTNQPLIPPPSEEKLDHKEITLAERFKQAGYKTAHIGKWHLGTTSHGPETQGFDVSVGGTHWGAPQTYFYPYKGTQRFNGEYRFVPGLGQGKDGDYLTDQFTDAAIREIDAFGGSPFFLNLWFHNPHTPIEAKPAYAAYFEKKIRPEHKHKNAQYAGMLKSLSENTGRLLAHLEKRGLAKNTVVVFFSDNGGFTEKYDGRAVTNNFPLRSGKGSLYEGGVRVPFLLRWPGVTPANSTCDTPVWSCDFFPTFMEMAGLGGTSPDGVSIVPLLKNPKAQLPARDLHFHYPHYYATTSPVSMIRSGDWKLLEYFDDGHVELFQLREDPSESRDLASEQPARANELKAKLHAWRNSVGARLPVRNPAVAKR